MRKGIFAFVAIVLLLTVGLAGHRCSSDKTDVEAFGERLTYAWMFESQDPVYGFAIRYPAFFTPLPDTLNTREGYMRFSYNDHYANIALEGYAEPYPPLPMKAQRDSLVRVVHAIHIQQRGDSILVSGPMYIGSNPVEGYSFYAKYVHHRHLWMVYRIIYPAEYHPALKRLFKEIHQWQVWPPRRPILRYGEDQAPKRYRKK